MGVQGRDAGDGLEDVTESAGSTWSAGKKSHAGLERLHARLMTRNLVIR